MHGGGREIDAALAQVGIPKRQVDGLRVTDADTLNIVVSVLAGSINTKFVAAINAAGGKAVGLTGADAGVAPVEKAAPHKATSGETVDLGMVGTPLEARVARGHRDALPGRLRPGRSPASARRRTESYSTSTPIRWREAWRRGCKAKRLVDRGRDAGRARQEEPDDRQARSRSGIEKLVKSGTANAGHGREAGGVPGGAEGRREERA